MTIHILGFIITITKKERPEPVKIDRAQAKKDAESIITSPAFVELKAQAQAARALRNL